MHVQIQKLRNLEPDIPEKKKNVPVRGQAQARDSLAWAFCSINLSL